MITAKKAIKWAICLVLSGVTLVIAAMLIFAGGCTPFQSTIRANVIRIVDEIYSSAEALALNRFTPLDLGAKVVGITIDNKLFEYDIDVKLSNDSSTYLKIVPEWRFCVPSRILPANAFISEETSERLALPPEAQIERQSERTGATTGK